MLTITSLWLPIMLSAVGVWLVSAVVWMVLPHHRSDYKGLPDEESARTLLRDVPRGMYNVPNVEDQAAMGTPEGRKKFDDGPVLMMTVFDKGVPNMAVRLGQWFAFNLAVGVTVAYLASRSLPPDAEYLLVFRVTATIAWLAYGAAAVQESIWFGRPWIATVKQLFDALLYGLVTGGVFGWLWS